MTRAAGWGEVKSGVRVRAAASSSVCCGVTPSVTMIAAGAGAKRRSTKLPSVPASNAPMTWMLLGWVRLRWPISEADAAASRRTAAELSRPAIQASDSTSRLSSCSRATSTCSIGMPRRDQLVQGGSIGGLRHRFALAPVAEHLRELGEHLQVLLGGLLGHEQDEHQAHRR